MQRRKRISFIASALTLAGAAPSAMAQGTPSPLIPREVFFGNPDKAGVQLSPDGKQIAFLAPVNDVLNVWVGPIADPSKAKPVTDDKVRGIRNYFWAYTNGHLLYTQDKGGDENWRLYCVDLAAGTTKDLTPFDKVQARVQEVSHKTPNEILVALNNRNPQLHDIHRVNLLTGQMTLVEQNDEGYAGYLTDDDYHIRFAVKMTPDGGSEIFKAADGGTWISFTKITADDNMTTNPVGLDKSGRNLYMLDSRGRNTAALTLLNIETSDSKMLAEDPKADITDFVVHPTEYNVQAVGATFDRRKWQILDPAIKDDFAALAKVADGEFNITSRTLDDGTWTVAYVMDNGPVRYYTYDRKTKKANFLFTNKKDLEALKLARMHPTVIKSRDGLDLVSYLTLPEWTDSDGDARPDKPLPLVLFVHGGPWARDQWGLNPYHQWLSNRGYAVLSVNYRGSTGFGKNFINAANMQWSRKMHDDLIDAVNWTIEQKVADKNKVAIMGGSYGGYATLVGLTFTPDTFACGVDIVGPSSLQTLLESIPPYWAPMVDMFTTRVGDHRTEEGRKLLADCSPLTHVDKISRPLLIGQGANDPRVKQAESDQIVAAMKKKNIPVTYCLFPDEGHGFARPVNRMAFNAVTEAFLSEHIGGRFEPISENINDSTLQVPEGADGVKGLRTVLKASGGPDT
ncbi:MAG: S9 family peptidase [Phycisphaerae bacterium]|nr:MAG: S9 family peptidase [Planctomycetota bacterium]KAB2950028.1 MAG: S9 family peptidase [Phycisphaerae bacterium]MBE7458326.1 S9 family peptidase [Planctomycetia bacterium]MCK6465789.1 S9 family peptidase [Phycisphaerae bacterium]MCL4719301.1 S9 family peptidase [Phycisphaerae bacterium]